MNCGCEHEGHADGCGCNKKPVTQYIGDIPVDTLDSVVDYFLGERDIEDPNTGNVVRSLVRIPGGKLFPNANMDNVTALEANNEAITVPENQVRAVYVANVANTPTMLYADNAHKTAMLAVGELANMILVQNCGFVNIPNGHEYILGVQYYAGENGEPVTDASITGQKLFIPVSRTKLSVNL